MNNAPLEFWQSFSFSELTEFYLMTSNSLIVRIAIFSVLFFGYVAWAINYRSKLSASQRNYAHLVFTIFALFNIFGIYVQAMIMSNINLILFGIPETWMAIVLTSSLTLFWATGLFFLKLNEPSKSTHNNQINQGLSAAR